MLRRLTSLSKLLVCLIVPLVLVACSPKDENFPKLTGRVVDNAQVMSQQEQRSLVYKLEQIDKEKKIEIVVLTINKLPESEYLESYANKVFNKWGIGKKETDSGVLILIVKSDRKIRIETGRGVEGAMPDMVANRIIQEKLVPRFRKDQFYVGLNEAVDEIRRVLRNEEF